MIDPFRTLLLLNGPAINKNIEESARIMPSDNPYDDVIMDHIKNVRNYSVLNVGDKATGNNPLCGDEFTIYFKIGHHCIEDIAFQCTCCGISMASASIMTEMLKGKAIADAMARLKTFLAGLDKPAQSLQHDITRAQQAILSVVKKFPSRSRCAALPWVTLKSALDPAGESRLPV